MINKKKPPIFFVCVGPTWHCVVGRNFGSFVTHGKLFYQRQQQKKLIIFFSVSRIQAFYLLLSRSNCHSFVQVCLIFFFINKSSKFICNTKIINRIV